MSRTEIEEPPARPRQYLSAKEPASLGSHQLDVNGQIIATCPNNPVKGPRDNGNA
jgi:hypothetical protein